ncbi:MAG: hypothetical protein WDM81_03210 [Rhizomicrobium sp.]
MNMHVAMEEKPLDMEHLPPSCAPSRRAASMPAVPSASASRSRCT